MLTFKLFGFQVSVQPFFWIIMAMIGINMVRRFDLENDFMGIALWVTVVFVSVLWHELGHAFAFRRYRIGSDIVLHGFGGYAIPHQQPPRLSRGQDMIVSAAGPAFQLAIGLPLLWLNSKGLLWEFAQGKAYAEFVLMTLMFVNIWWPLFNLLPIYPLDGGQISHALFGPRHERTALWISFGFAVAVTLWALQMRMGFMRFMFAMMAWNNWCRLTGRPEVPM